MAARRPPFRPDVEGLRGIAILLVVLFHAGVPALAGGFVGVDLFFVLSGFFITGLLVRELDESGGVDLAAFYGRRALRLVPALLLVLLATLVAVMTLYAPIDRAPIADTSRAVALYSGNVHFARGAVDYFSSGENPLLHTWSLAVEEQFYLVWPLLFLWIALVHENRSTRAILAWIAGAGALSFAASLWLTRTAQPWAFFGLPARIWEFSLGGALAVLLTDRALGSRAFATGLQAAGVIAVAASVAAYDRSIPYPGVAALLPALGACALIAGGSGAPDTAIGRALSIAPLRWLGRLSYAWFLWHWPVVTVAAMLDPRIGVPGRLAWSAAALGLAWATHRFVEQPARDGRFAPLPASTVAPAMLMASLAAALVAHLALRAAERRVAQPDQRPFAAARVDRIASDCWATTVDEMRPPCELGDTRSSTVVALLGDSHAQHWLAGLDRAGRERGWKIVAMVKGGCPVADVPEMERARRARWYRECSRYREAMIRRIVAMRPAAVILSNWDHYLPREGAGSDWQVTPAGWREGLRRTYGRLTAAGIHTIVLRDVPRTPFDVPGCLSRRAAGLPFAGECVYDRASSLFPLAVAAQDDAARGLPVRMVDMNDQLCDTPRCAVVRKGVVVFTDDNHLTATFSRTVAPVLGERIAAAMAAR